MAVLGTCTYCHKPCDPNEYFHIDCDWEYATV